MADELLADEVVTTTSSAGVIQWALTDQVGTVRDIGKWNSGNDEFEIANHRVYNSFGELESETNGSIDLSFGFAGKWTEPETGYTFHLNRWYDPKVGKWLSEDPIGFGGGDANLTRYVTNRALTSTDSNGLNEDQGQGRTVPTNTGEGGGENEENEDILLIRAADPYYKPRKKSTWIVVQLKGEIGLAGWEVRGNRAPPVRYPPDLLDVAANFAAGWADILSFSTTDSARDLFGINDGVRKGSKSYIGGKILGVLHLIAIGGAAGATKTPGPALNGLSGAPREFSHWIPKRFVGDTKTILNGNWVPPRVHIRSDPSRLRFVPKPLKPGYAPYPIVLAHWIRFPKIYKGAAAAGLSWIINE